MGAWCNPEPGFTTIINDGYIFLWPNVEFFLCTRENAYSEEAVNPNLSDHELIELNYSDILSGIDVKNEKLIWILAHSCGIQTLKGFPFICTTTKTSCLFIGFIGLQQVSSNFSKQAKV